eukprot:Hpha_TRINITY_DN16497_c1_g3::TRINITY_DN16497_c1_g3_i4::g.161144::m.161144
MNVVKLTEIELVQTAGLDAFVFLTVLKFGTKIFAQLGFITCAVLAPVYAVGENDFGDVQMFTLGNIKNESAKLWAPVVMAWIVSLVVWYCLWQAYSSVVKVCKTMQHLSGANSFSVAVFDLPEKIRDERELHHYFDQFFPGEVQAVQICRETNKLSDCCEALTTETKELKHAEAVLETTGERPKHVVLSAPHDGKQDSITVYQANVDRLQKEVDLVRRKETIPAETAFISFTSPICAAKAAQLWYEQSGYRVTEAPEPRDVYWPNMLITEKLRSSRQTLVAVASAALVFLWAFPVAFISTFTTLDNLEKWVPFIKSILDLSDALTTFLTGFLPTVALMVFMALLPKILMFFSKVEGLHSWSLIDRAVLKKMYYFEVVNVYFVTALGGAVLASIGDIIDTPSSAFRLLGEAIPKVSVFFTSYVVLQGLGKFPFSLLRVGPLIVNAIWKRRGAVTHQERCECDDPGPNPPYGVAFSAPLLMFTIVLIYSVISPFILPFGMLYFALAYLCNAYNLVYVFRTKYQSNGKLWPLAFSRMIAGLFIMQITMIGIMSLKYATIQGPFLIPLPILNLFYLREIQGRYRRVTTETPLAALLRPEGRPLDESFDPSFLDRAYLRPCLKPELDGKSPQPVPYFPEEGEASISGDVEKGEGSTICLTTEGEPILPAGEGGRVMAVKSG